MDAMRGRALEAIYAAALDPRLWQRAMDSVAASSGGVKTHMLHARVDASTPERSVVSGYDPEFLESFDRYYGAHNAWGQSFASGPLLQPVYAEQMCSFPQLSKTEFYADWVRPQGDIIGGGGIVLDRSPGQLLLFGGNIPRALRDRLDEGWQRDLVLFGPAIRMAVATNAALLGLRLDLLLAKEGSDATGHALFLLDQKGTLIFANATAQDMLGAGNLVHLGVGSRVNLTDTRAEMALRRMLADTGISRPAALSLAGREVRMFNVTEETGEALGLPPMVPGRRAAVVLAISSGAQPSAFSAAHLASLLGLSAAEADIALSLAGGLTPTEIAEARQSSIHTVRNQLKSAMAKLDLRRQSDLVAVVVRLQQR